MARSAIAIAFLSLGLSIGVGCGSPEPATSPACAEYVVAIDPSLSPSWQGAARRAISEWSESVPSFHASEGAPLSSCSIAFVARAETGEHTGEVDGWTKGARPSVVSVPLDTREVDDELELATTLHEMGHVLGLEHEMDRGLDSIMFPFLERAPRVHEIDRARACAIWRCP